MSSSQSLTGTPIAPLSSANTITAASSQANFNDSSAPTPIPISTYSQLDLTRSRSPGGDSDMTRSTHTSWLNASLNLRYINTIVLTTCFITGLTDTATFANYNAFVSMQTGNTIFIALGTSHQNTHPFVWVRCLFSLFAYCLGTFLFARLHDKILAPKTRRLTVLLTYAIQTILIIISAAIIQSGVVGRYRPGVARTPQQQWDSLAPICLLSLGAGGQIIAARSLGIPEVPSVVVTTMLCELWSDPGLFWKRNPGRDRRAAAFILMLLGAITGGWVDKVSGSTQAALWMAAGLKFSCVVAVAFWKGESFESHAEDEKSNV